MKGSNGQRSHCRMDHAAHLPHLQASASLLVVMATLFVAGLAGSTAHCATMCSPFVLAQLRDADRGDGPLRLVRVALLPYHFGRATTYAALGAALGGLGAGLSQSTVYLRPLLAIFLLLAAGIFLLQAVKEAGWLPLSGTFAVTS